MIPDPVITGHARPLIARLELPMCFQPDGGISDSSSESDEGDDDVNRQSLPPRPLVPELQRDSLYQWFEMRATWDLRGIYSLAPTSARASKSLRSAAWRTLTYAVQRHR